METEFANLSMMGLSVVLDVIVTIIIVRRLCQNNLICSFNKPSLILFNVLILIFCTILIRLDISMGTGVGLFAVLAMFRFRSEVLKTQEMFYLLMLIGIGFVHAAFPDVLSLTEVLFIDAALIAMSFMLSKTNGPTKKFKIVLDDVNLINPSNEGKLTSMLEEQLGYTFNRIEVIDVNLKKERVVLLLETNTPIEDTTSERKIDIAPSLNISHRNSIPIAVN